MTSDQARARVGRPRSVHVEVVLTSTPESGENGVRIVQTTEHDSNPGSLLVKVRRFGGCLRSLSGV